MTRSGPAKISFRDSVPTNVTEDALECFGRKIPRGFVQRHPTLSMVHPSEVGDREVCVV